MSGELGIIVCTSRKHVGKVRPNQEDSPGLPRFARRAQYVAYDTWSRRMLASWPHSVRRREN